MDRPLIMMSSVTNAMRGREILRRHGISSEIERTPRGSARQGCGYSLYVKKNADEAEKILHESGTRVLGRAERGVGR